MREFIENIEDWATAGKIIAMARVVQTWGSSPRPSGSVMLVDEEGKMSGSVSGGCVEGAVVKKALQIMPDKKDTPLQFGVSDEDAWSVGLSCGGQIQVYLQTIDLNKSVWPALMNAIKNNQSAILITSLTDGNSTNTLLLQDGTITGDEISEELITQARQAYNKRIHTTAEFDNKTYFIQLFPRKPLLLVIGAAHITSDLVSLGNFFGFETVVIDPRGFFADNTTFNDPPSRILKSYPAEVLPSFPLDAYTFAAILSHDPKIDDNALEVLLPSEVAYIGALGSRKTHEKRKTRLSAKGISAEMIDRIHAPIGLRINAKSAREIALSVIGEIIGIKNEFN